MKTEPNTSHDLSPILSDTEHDVIVAALDLTAKHIGAQIQQIGLAGAEQGAGKLNAIRELTEKLNASKVEPVQEVQQAE